MKVLALLFAFLLFYPILTIFVLYFQHSDRTVLSEQLQFILWGYFGCLSGWMLTKVEKKSKKGLPKIVSFLLTLLPGIIPIVGSNLFHASGEKGFLICMGIIAFGAYLLGNRLYFKPYGKLVATTNLILGIVGSFICLFVMRIFQNDIFPNIELSFSYTPLLYLFLVWVGLYTALKNQANIDQLMNRRKHKMEDLPKKIRYYNLLLIVGLFAIIVILFCLRGWIVDGIYWFLRRLRDLVVIIAQGIYFVFSLINRGGAEIEDEPTKHKEVSQQFTDNGGGYGEIFLVVLLIALVGVIINFRKQIFNFLMDRLQKLFAWIQKLFQRSPLFEGFQQSSEYYRDEIEDVRGQLIEEPKAQHTLKDWKKLCKNYFKMNQSTEKLKTGYHLLNEWLVLKGVSIKSSDTPLEILKKGEPYLKNLPGLSMTEGYHLFKYRDEEPSEQTLTELTEILRKLNTL